MAFSIVGWVAAALRLRYSWGSLALRSALAWPTPSSNAALVALKYSADRRSKAANCVCARPRMASMPALFVVAICSGVKFMIISVKVGMFAVRVRALVPWCILVLLRIFGASQQIEFYKDNNRCQEIFVRRNKRSGPRR